MPYFNDLEGKPTTPTSQATAKLKTKRERHSAVLVGSETATLAWKLKEHQFDCLENIDTFFIPAPSFKSEDNGRFSFALKDTITWLILVVCVELIGCCMITNCLGSHSEENL